MIRVNLDPGVVACPEPQRLYRGIDRVLEIAGGRPNGLMGTGALSAGVAEPVQDYHPFDPRGGKA
jgi:hypothetical protein